MWIITNSFQCTEFFKDQPNIYIAKALQELHNQLSYELFPPSINELANGLANLWAEVLFKAWRLFATKHFCELLPASRSGFCSELQACRENTCWQGRYFAMCVLARTDTHGRENRI